MKIIQRAYIDTERWDALVESDVDADIFSLSDYLDLTAENWCILVDENYTTGMALPFTNRLGVRTCYTPIFVRGVRWLGEKPENFNEIIAHLQIEFPKGQLAVHGFSKRPLDTKWMFQVVDAASDHRVSERGRRMLKKFSIAQFRVQDVTQAEDILKHIERELPKKIEEINAKSIQTLRALTQQFSTSNQFIGLEVFDKKNQSVGGILVLQNKGKLLYLKGAFEEQAKKQGAMYGAMYHAIQLAHAMNLSFDFGGSRVAGVRNFNLTLGGTDSFYEMLIWDKSPFWFKLLKTVKDLWKRK